MYKSTPNYLVMDKRVKSGRTEPIPSSILKKTKERRLIDKTSKIKKEKVAPKSDDVTVPLPQGCTPLMYACQQADYKSVVETLNKDPSSSRARDRGLRCALHYCASSGAGASAAARAACADRVLMSAPALGNARDADGLTPLHLAVVHGNVPLVQTLLAAGADVNARDDEHHTVVHWATVCGEVGALRAVLAAGADAATPDQHGGYPLHYAAQMCGAPAATDHQTRGAALEVLRALVKEGGARVEVRDADGRTPLLWAASAGSAAAVLALHQAGAKVDDADRDGLTALHCAAARGHTEALETLVGLCGARVDVADSHGCTPLHYAAALGHADATAALLQHGADAHRQDKRGRSPAHTAAAKGQFETVKMLGARGTNLWLRNSKGDLPLHEAVSSGRRELVKWLLDGRPSQVNATNHEGRTPLHVAAATNNTDLCRLLIDRGAEVNPVARSSKNVPVTPLDCATNRGHRSTAKYLQMHGGLPAAKLNNTQIVIDNTPITGLPTRRVTSTKIDVNDKIFIEKREVLELSSPVTERRRFHSRSRLNEMSSESESDEKTKRRRKYSTKQRGRHKKIVEQKKSFSDGYETELEHLQKEHFNERQSKSSKRNRSKSEPLNRRSSISKHEKKHYLDSENSSDSNKYANKKKDKRHKRKNKRISSDSDSSSYESSDRRNTKRKGKRTSIHIENDEEKQSVNIVKYKNTDEISKIEKIEGNLSVMNSIESQSLEQNKSDLTKQKQHSETETDTVSLKTNILVTEAQIHVERNNSDPSEITVTMDSSNNVSIETNNVTLMHKDLTEGVNPTKEEKIEVLNDTNKETTAENKNESHEIKTTIEESQIDKTDKNLKETDKKNIIDLPLAEEIKPEIEQEVTKHLDELKQKPQESETSPTTKVNSQERKNDVSSPTGPAERVRKRSFEVLSGPEDTTTNDGDSKQMQSHDKIIPPGVSFASQDEIFESKDSGSQDHPMGEIVNHNVSLHSQTVGSSQENSQKSESLTVTSGEKRKEYGSTTASSTEITQSTDKSNTINDTLATDRAIQQVLMENVPEEILLELAASPKKTLKKTTKDGQDSRKSSIYETESYKVLSDIASATDAGTGILKKSSQFDDGSYDEDKLSPKVFKDGLYGRVPSVSDNEIYQTEANSRRKRFRKKGRTKSRMTIRSKSENSELGYESSGMMDSGFEPSPRVVQRRVMSPRLAAYYRQRNSSGKYTGKTESKIPVRKPGDKYAVDMKSVTQRIQTNMRRYYCERKIFHHLLELKRLQIRTSKTNEAVLVKRAIDEYNQSSLAHVGLGPYNNPDFSFSSFEKFLYESLRKLQRSGKKHLDNLPEKSIDFDYGESELYKMSAIPDNPCLCTHKTHRCFHAVHAYTGIPCSAYIPHKWNHHTMPKPGTAGGNIKSKGFLPKINSKPVGNKAHVTLEVTHGSEKQLIALPAEKLDKNKKYYVTFTVKGSEPPSENDATPSGTPKQKSVKSG